MEILNFYDRSLNGCRKWIDKMIERDPANEATIGLLKAVNEFRRQMGLPFVFPAGLGRAQVVDGITGYLSLGDLEALKYCALNVNGKCVNIGVHNGLSAYFIAKHNPRLEVYGVDAYRGMSARSDKVNEKTMKIAEDNLARLKNTQLIIGMSCEVAGQWRDDIGFLFIDGNHLVEGAVSDFEAWSPFVVEGGLVAVHDAYGKVSASVMELRRRDGAHGPDVVCGMLAESSRYEFVMVSGCTEIWQKTRRK
jgi:predicted O-methyltransferase YrrM